MTETLIDLSHTVEDGMITYRGLPGPAICDFWSRESTRGHYAEGTFARLMARPAAGGR